MGDDEGFLRSHDKNNRVQFRLTIRRNITVLRGKSATGKTTLVGMVGDYQRDGADSGVELRCERPCVVLEGSGWESGLARYSRSIVFIDEGSRFTSSVEFARAAAASDNYFAIATRESLFNLPYSVAEVYGIDNDTRQKYRNVWRYYSSPRQLYGGHQPIVGTGLSSSRKVVLGRECQDLSRAVMTGAEPRRSKTEVQGRAFVPTLVIVEDSGSGFEFFRALCSIFNVPCGVPEASRISTGWSQHIRASGCS